MLAVERKACMAVCSWPDMIISRKYFQGELKIMDSGRVTEAKSHVVGMKADIIQKCFLFGL